MRPDPRRASLLVHGSRPTAWLALALGLLVCLGAALARAQDTPRPGVPGPDRAPARDTRPNVLFVFADDLRADALGHSGNPVARTPHLDALAQRGTTFRRAYCMGSPHGAVCVPSRAMLHTGRSYFRVDHGDFRGARTMGEALGAAGYSTFATGKWHNGGGAFLRSFQRARNVMFSGMSDHWLVPVRDIEAGEIGPERTATQHSSELFAESAIQFLREHDGAAPYFCYLAFSAPHDPRDAPEPWRERAYSDLPPLPANFMPQHPFEIGMLTARDEGLAPWPRPRAMLRQQLAEYYALIAHMDDAFGRVLAAAEARDDGRATLVVFAADNGLALGSHGLMGKQSVYEHSLRVPLVLAGPGVPVGVTSNALLYLCDLYPTLLEAAGVTGDVEAGHQRALLGRSLWPLLRGERAELRESLFLAIGDTQRALTDGRYKLIRYPRIDQTRLYDLAGDPHELFDLATRPEHATRVAELTARMQAWQRDVGDRAPLTVAEPEPAAVDLTGHERSPDVWQPRWIREKYFGASGR